MGGIAPAAAASVVRIAAPVGVTSSRFTPVSTTGKPFSSSAVPGAGTGHTPVRARDETSADRQGRAVHGVHTQQVEADARAGDVHDGVHRAHVVEVDLVARSCRARAPRPRRAA